MPKTRKLTLSAEQTAELRQIRDHHPKSYLRERAAALLKIAGGEVASQVAGHGLLKARDPDTVYSWIDAYQADGVAGLQIKQGRGRKPAFSPSAPVIGGG
jgi:transposase